MKTKITRLKYLGPGDKFYFLSDYDKVTPRNKHEFLHVLGESDNLKDYFEQQHVTHKRLVCSLYYGSIKEYSMWKRVVKLENSTIKFKDSYSKIRKELRKISKSLLKPLRDVIDYEGLGRQLFKLVGENKSISESN